MDLDRCAWFKLHLQSSQACHNKATETTFKHLQFTLLPAADDYSLLTLLFITTKPYKSKRKEKEKAENLCTHIIHERLLRNDVTFYFTPPLHCKWKNILKIINFAFMLKNVLRQSSCVALNLPHSSSASRYFGFVVETETETRIINSDLITLHTERRENTTNKSVKPNLLRSLNRWLIGS